MDMASSKCKLEWCRRKRKQNLQREVQQTLCLTPPLPPTGQACDNCPLTLEEQKQAYRQYQEKLRMNRILQVRAQERLLASQRVAEFGDRKAKDSKLLLNHLKEVWKEDQRRRIQCLEEEFAGSCRNIGRSHDAAVLVEKNRAAKEELLARQAEESRCWDLLRFEEAMHKERELKERKERENCTATLRRKIVASVSSIERSFARRYNHGTKSKPINNQLLGCYQTVNPPVTHDVKRERSYCRLAGFPADFRDTYLHSRFDVLQDRTNQPSYAVVNCPEQEEVDAWRAADAWRERNRCDRAQRIELERLYNERSLERGTAAAAKLLNDQRMAMLEQEVEEAYREEEREKDRLYAATNSGICKPATLASQERRSVYIKHKISNPLSCPGSVITEGPKFQQGEFDDQTVIAQTEREPEPLLGYPDPNAEQNQDQNLLSIETQEETDELADLTSNQLQQEVQHRAEELNDEIASTLESFSGKELKPSAQMSVADASDLFLELEVPKAPQQIPAQSKSKGISPLRASCGEHGGLINARDSEGILIKLPREKPHMECSMLSKALGDVISNESTSKGLLNSSKRVEKNISRSTRRWRARKKGSENSDVSKNLAEKVFPKANGCHLKSVQMVEEVHQEDHSRGALQGCVQSTEGVDIQKSKPKALKAIRPLFMSSGPVGYKKILPESLRPQSSRPSKTRKSEGRKPKFNKEMTLSMRSERKKLKTPSEGPDLDGVKVSAVASEYVSPRRRTSRPLTELHAIDISEINKDDAPPRESEAYHLPSYFELPNPHENNSSNSVNEEKMSNCGDQLNNMEGIREYSASKGIRDAEILKSENKSSKSISSVLNGHAGILISEGILEDDESRNIRNKEGDMERQEKTTQVLRLKQKAVWKSYMNEKIKTKKYERKTTTGKRSIKSEPSSPALRIRTTHSRPGSTLVYQDNWQSGVRSKQPVAHSNVRNCFTPGGSATSPPLSRSRFARGISVPRSWKHFATNSKEIELEALENITSIITSLSKRSMLSFKQVPLETGSLRSQKDLNFKEPETSRSSSSSKERVRSVKRDGSKFSGSTQGKLIRAWKTGKCREEFSQGMKREKKPIDVPSSEGTSNTHPDRNYKPWPPIILPRKITSDQEMGAVSLENQGKETDLSEGPMTRSKNKSLLSYSPIRTTDLVRSYIENDTTNPGSMSRPSFVTKLSPKSLFNSKVRKSSSLKKIPSVTGKESSSTEEDAWETQSLDLVLGSLAEQVRDLDERLRSATSTSPATSLISSLGRDLNANDPILNTSTSGRLLKDHGNPLSSVASSPERYAEESSCSTPPARHIRRSDARDCEDSVSPDIPYPSSGRPAWNGTNMNDREKLLKIVSNDNSNSIRTHVSSSRIIQRVKMEENLLKIQDKEMETELLSLVRKNSNPTKLAAASASSTSVSDETSRMRSATSLNDTCEVNVVTVKKERTHVEGNDVVDEANSKDQRDHRFVHERFHANCNARMMGAEEKSLEQVTDRVKTARDMRGTKVYGRRDMFRKNSFREYNGMKRALLKSLTQRRWTQQTRENDDVGVKKRSEKRTIEVRGCTPQRIIHRGCGVLRGQLVKEVVENGFSFSELDGSASFESIISSHKERKIHEVENDKRGLIQPKRDAYDLSVHQQVPSNGKLFTNDIAEGHIQLWGHAESIGNNGHAVTTKHLSKKPELQLAKIQAKVSGFSNGEIPVWKHESSGSSGSWTNGSMSWDEMDDQMLLSGSVDFSPWKTDRLPDITTPKTEIQDSNCSKSSSVAAEAAGITA